MQDLFFLVRGALGSQAEPFLHAAVKFTVQHSKTAVDFRNSVYNMVFHGLPQSEFVPDSLVNQHANATWLVARINALPERLGEFIADASRGPLTHHHARFTTNGNKEYLQIPESTVRELLYSVYECTEEASSRAVQALSDAPAAKLPDGMIGSSKIGPSKLRTPFSERATAGNVGYMLLHQLQRQIAIRLNRDAAGTPLPDRDEDGYPLALAADGIVDANFFDANAIAASVVTLACEHHVEVTDWSVEDPSRHHRATAMESTITEADLPFARNPSRAGEDSAARTHRQQDFNRKLVMAAWLLQDPADLEAVVRARDEEGAGHWLTGTLSGRSVRWDEFSPGAKRRYASHALAFADAYVGFSRPPARVYYDVLAPIPNTPHEVSWNDTNSQSVLVYAGHARSDVQIVRFQINGDNTLAPADAVPAGQPPGHRTSVRAAFLAGRAFVMDACPNDDLRNGVRGIDLLRSIGAKYDELRRSPLPNAIFALWCKEHPTLGIGDVRELREAISAFLTVAKSTDSHFNESHAAVRRAAQLAGLIDRADAGMGHHARLVATAETVVRVSPKFDQRGGLAGRTRRLSITAPQLDTHRAEARKRKFGKEYARLRAKMRKIDSHQRLWAYLQRQESVPDGEEDEVATMLSELYLFLTCADTDDVKGLIADMLDTLGYPLPVANLSGDTIYGAEIGAVVLQRIVDRFVPDADASKAKFQSSCGGAPGVAVKFGIGCGLSSHAEEVYRSDWAVLQADEVAAIEAQLERHETNSALAQIWDVARPVKDKIDRTAALAAEVLVRRFADPVRASKPPNFEAAWGMWNEATDKVALATARAYAEYSKGTFGRLDTIRKELYPDKAPEQLEDERQQRDDAVDDDDAMKELASDD